MRSILASHPPTRLPPIGDTFNLLHSNSNNLADCTRIFCLGCANSDSFIRPRVTGGLRWRRVRGSFSTAIFSGKLNGTVEGDDDDDSEKNEINREGSRESETNSSVNSDMVRESLEKIVGTDDSSFSGIDLATLIRNKYGRSYDVQLIKKEFMGRNLLAMNVMWKYMEQRSFPLTEEEYILRLDDVANNLKCWGAVSHVRNTLQKSKERPRIGKAVSIFIDMDESGGRANEWIYK